MSRKDMLYARWDIGRLRGVCYYVRMISHHAGQYFSYRDIFHREYIIRVKRHLRGEGPLLLLKGAAVVPTDIAVSQHCL